MPESIKAGVAVDDLENKGGGLIPSEDMKAVKEQLAGISEEIVSLRSKAAEWPSDAPLPAELASMKSQIKALAETTEKITEADYSGVLGAFKEQLAELKSSMDLVNANGGPDVFAGIVSEIRDSTEFKSIFNGDGTAQNFSGWKGGKITSLTAKSLEEKYGIKAVTPISTTSVDGAIQDAYRPGIARDQLWPQNALARIPKKVVSGTNTYVIPKETQASRYGYVTSTLEVAIDGDPTPKSTATFNEVEGFVPGTIVRFFTSTDSGETTSTLLGSAEIVSINTSTRVVTFVTDSLDFDAAIGDRVVSENFGAVDEGAQKPFGWAEIGDLTYTYKILATLLPVNIATLNTLIGFRQWIEEELPMRWERNLSWHVLYGTDSAATLQGFRTYTGAQSYLWSSGQTGDNRTDAVIRSCMLIPWTAPVGVIMSQKDLDKLLLEKLSDGHYVQSNVFGAISLGQVGGSWFLGPYELIFDYACVEGDFTAVQWSEASEFLDQGTAALTWGYENDDFSKNIIKARYEGTVMHAIRSTQAFVVGEWDSAPS